MKESVPGLLNSPGGLKIIADVYKNIADRQRQALEYVTKQGRYNNGTRLALSKMFEGKSVLPKALLDKYEDFKRRSSIDAAPDYEGFGKRLNPETGEVEYYEQ